MQLGSAEARKYPEEDKSINLPTLRENEMVVVESADQKAIFEESYPVEASPYDSTVNDQKSTFSVAIEVKNCEKEAKDKSVVGADATKVVNFDEKKASHLVSSDDDSLARKKFSLGFDPDDASIYHGDSLVGEEALVPVADPETPGGAGGGGGGGIFFENISKHRNKVQTIILIKV